MNTPNKLTVLRIILVPFLVAVLLNDSLHLNYLFALIIFIIASITDFFDGKIARKRNLITDFGKFADPLADKILVLSVLICFVQLGLVNSVIVILILFREFAVTSIRLVAASKGEVVAANNWGKAKTISQIVSIVLILSTQLTMQIMQESLPTYIGGIIVNVSNLSIYISALITLISGLIYIKQNIKFIKDS